MEVARVSTLKISKKQARQFILTHQGLLKTKETASKDYILNYIKKVGCIQYDPLNKVGRNPHLVLQSRFKNYKKDYLRELLYKDRKLIDAWDKNMSIFPVEDWPYFKRNRDKAYNKYQKKKELVENVIPEVRKKIKNKGPLSSIDLDFDEKVDWSWAPTRAARAALESMYQWGELIIEHKVGTRKVYDFTDKYISENILNKEDPNQSQEDYHKWYIKRRIESIGMLWDLSGSAWLGIKDLNKNKRVKAISTLIEQDELSEVKIEKIKHPVYIKIEELPLLKEIINGVDINSRVSFIAPLDNILWDRKFIKRVFDFEYVWEVYKPVKEREYGYYVLPILHKDKFIGRFEPVLDKKKKELIVKNCWWKNDIDFDNELKMSLRTAFIDFMKYLDTKSIKINNNKELSWLEDINN
jgi:hypothetical protein